MPKSKKLSLGGRRRYNYSGGYASMAARAANTIGAAYRIYSAGQRATGAKARFKGRSGSAIERTGKFLTKVENDGQGGTVSKSHMGSSPDYYGGKIDKSIGKLSWIEASAAHMDSAVGLQNAFAFANACTDADVIQMYNQLNASSDTSRLVVNQVHSELLLTNNRLGNCHVTLYDIIARKDGLDPTSGSPYDCWNTGDINSGSGATPILQPGTMPTESDLFNQFWKVVHKTEVIMSGGGTHRHIRTHTPNKFIHQEYAERATSSLRDLTTCTLIVMHGQPAQDSTTHTQVSLGAASLALVATRNIKFSSLYNQFAVVSYDNNLPSSFTVAEEIVNIGGSTISANTEV